MSQVAETELFLYKPSHPREVKDDKGRPTVYKVPRLPVRCCLSLLAWLTSGDTSRQGFAHSLPHEGCLCAPGPSSRRCPQPTLMEMGCTLTSHQEAGFHRGEGANPHEPLPTLRPRAHICKSTILGLRCSHGQETSSPLPPRENNFLFCYVH